jgi:hypothetical protein
MLGWYGLEIGPPRVVRLKGLGPRVDLLVEMKVVFLLEPHSCLMPTRRGPVHEGRRAGPCQAGHRCTPWQRQGTVGPH